MYVHVHVRTSDVCGLPENVALLAWDGWRLEGAMFHSRFLTILPIPLTRSSLVDCAGSWFTNCWRHTRVHWLRSRCGDRVSIATTMEEVNPAIKMHSSKVIMCAWWSHASQSSYVCTCTLIRVQYYHLHVRRGVVQDAGALKVHCRGAQLLATCQSRRVTEGFRTFVSKYVDIGVV